jgi:hypothetical protein
MLQKFYVSFMKPISGFFNPAFCLVENSQSNTKARVRMTIPLTHNSSITISLIQKLKLLALTLSIALFTSGCAMNQLKEREAALSLQQQALTEQQQELAEQQQQLAEQQQLLNRENDRLDALKEELRQEEMRLSVLKKTPNVTPRPSPVIQSSVNSHIILGELEYIYLSPPDIKLTARIDTGAKTSSLNAMDLTEFERDGKAHVRFYLINPKTKEKIEVVRRIMQHVKIKEHEGDAVSRPVVQMRVRLGNLDQHIKMTLTDRSDFKNQVLIGRNFLRDFATVDVSQKFLTKPVIIPNQ